MLLLIKTVFLASLVALALGFFHYDEFPPHAAILPQLNADPVQEAVNLPPFETTVNRLTYRIKPLYRYELYGLVVSKHEADGFIDYVHKQWGDYLNTADICVVWGRNALSGIYTEVEFSSGQWTCYASAPNEIGRQFSMHHLSNNHMLADRPDLQKKIKEARIGDQIHFKGYLAEYSRGNFRRGTSTVRTDSGNGACETVYAESLDILKRAPSFWRTIRWLAAGMLCAAILAWFMLPSRYHVRG
jgi:hypothetical protein